jgi:hypothetical protein
LLIFVALVAKSSLVQRQVEAEIELGWGDEGEKMENLGSPSPTCKHFTVSLMSLNVLNSTKMIHVRIHEAGVEKGGEK